MQPNLSIIIPTLAKKSELTTLFGSLKNQERALNTEVLLCATNPPDNFSEELPELPTHFDLKVIESPTASISRARNCGIQNATGDIILFIDEDCALPSTTYFDQIAAAYRDDQDYCGGGYYLNPTVQSYLNRGYNYICNFWLNRYRYKKNETSLLLGGCSVYPSHVIKKSKAHFPEDSPRSGEEYSFNNSIKQGNNKIFIDDQWSVYHTPFINLKDFCMKAWIQGKTIGNSHRFHWPQSTMGSVRSNPKGFIAYFPLLIVYYLVGRLSYLCSPTK